MYKGTAKICICPTDLDNISDIQCKPLKIDRWTAQAWVIRSCGLQWVSVGVNYARNKVWVMVYGLREVWVRVVRLY